MGDQLAQRIQQEIGSHQKPLDEADPIRRQAQSQLRKVEVNSNLARAGPLQSQGGQRLSDKSSHINEANQKMSKLLNQNGNAPNFKVEIGASG
mmetsp:Transcript_7078/g.11924  ORF Transcript_7078/g.11924 Transcript_7078/m.11924 type:complete len:93 (-) Transcript_7078:385-663(-)